MENFSIFHDAVGHLCDAVDRDHTFELWRWSKDARWQPDSAGTHFVVVSRGQITIECASGEFMVKDGMVFCAPGQLALRGSGSAFGITAHNYKGLFQLVGPVEPVGRLRYIDGCTDSVLVSPQVKGEPCLNHLHFPPRTEQTRHTHPSFRAGLVLRGRGICRLTSGDVPLVPGCMFHLPSGLLHGFHTEHDSMDVIAFHPDSDCGPQDDDHPMVNRTFVDGIAANNIARIRT